jgi:hypothetical protein
MDSTKLRRTGSPRVRNDDAPGSGPHSLPVLGSGRADPVRTRLIVNSEIALHLDLDADLLVGPGGLEVMSSARAGL